MCSSLPLCRSIVYHQSSSKIEHVLDLMAECHSSQLRVNQLNQLSTSTSTLYHPPQSYIIHWTTLERTSHRTSSGEAAQVTKALTVETQANPPQNTQHAPHPPHPRYPRNRSHRPKHPPSPPIPLIAIMWCPRFTTSFPRFSTYFILA